MKVIFEVINGRDAGRIVELSNETSNSSRPWITEMDALKISVHLNLPAEMVKIIISDGEIILNPEDSKGLKFSCMPSTRSTGKYNLLFYNYFGVAPIYIIETRNDTTNFIEVGELEVLARKTSVEQAQKMVAYILESGNMDLLREYGATRKGAGPSECEGLPPNRMIEHLEDTIHIMEHTIPIISKRPLHSLTSELTITNNPGSNIDIQDQGISWLCENLGVLEQTDDAEDFVLTHNDQKYRAASIQSPITMESNDIYENRVIHGFLESSLNFIHQMKVTVESNTKPLSLNKTNGYESFFNVMSEWIHLEAQFHAEKLDALALRVKRLKSLAEKYLKVSQTLIEPPKFTPKARANRNYSILYKAIHNWYKNTNIDWTAERFLMAINSIPKLFEIYSALLISNWLKNHGRILQNENQSLISVEINNRRIALRYEPEYWRTMHKKANETSIVGTQIKSAEEALRHWNGGKVHESGKYQLRSPDFVLECSDMNNQKQLERLLIIDAKYVNRRMAFEEKLPECTMKYVHGLATQSRKNLVEAMIILYPDSEGPWLDYHAWNYGLFGSTPQLPVLGALGLLGSTDDSKSTLENVLSRLIAIKDE